LPTLGGMYPSPPRLRTSPLHFSSLFLPQGRVGGWQDGLDIHAHIPHLPRGEGHGGGRESRPRRGGNLLSPSIRSCCMPRWTACGTSMATTMKMATRAVAFRAAAAAALVMSTGTTRPGSCDESAASRAVQPIPTTSHPSSFPKQTYPTRAHAPSLALAVHCTAQGLCSALHYTTLHFTAACCTSAVLHCTGPHRAVLHESAVYHMHLRRACQIDDWKRCVFSMGRAIPALTRILSPSSRICRKSCMVVLQIVWTHLSWNGVCRYSAADSAGIPLYRSDGVR
jgi:hypothetical protein